MSGLESFIDQTRTQEQITIPQSHNTLVVRLQEHTWVSISTENAEIARDNSSDPVIGFNLSPGTYSVQTNGVIENLSSEAKSRTPSLIDRLEQNVPYLLKLTSDAPDQNPVDGVGDVPADGISFCTITIEKVSPDGTLLTDQESQDELFLRTTGGTLMDSTGAQRIRAVQLQAGKAAFRLVSEPNPKVVTVSVFGRDPLLSKAEIQIEFI